MLFGKYCLLERVSIGGMAEIFRAKPFNAPESRKHLALKRILPHLAEDDEFVQMFIDEATLTVQLVHPNIVRTYELGRFYHAPYILMEFISGKELLELQRTLRRQKDVMGVQMACYIAQEIARGMDYVHAKTDENGNPLNIIHRDISPQNVLVTYGGNVKIIDFGIAKGTFQETRTQVGVLKGKFGYMSPDQVRLLPLDHRSDIFSIGTLLWELLTNRRLFRGDNDFETLQMLRDPEVLPPSEYNSAIPPEVDAIVAKMLAAERDERYQTGGEVAAAIGAYLQSQGGFGAAQMSAWMAHTYADDVREERKKRQEFQQINTPDDVRRVSNALAQAEHSADSPQADYSTPQALWDSEIAPQENEDVDHFASEHTIVAAGGFDSFEFAAETEEEVLLVGADDIIEVSQAPGFSAPGAEPQGADNDTGDPIFDRATHSLPAVDRHQLQSQDFGATDTPHSIPNPAHRPATNPRLKLIAGAALFVACLLAAVTLVLWKGRGGDESAQAVAPGGSAAAGVPLAATLVLSVSPPTGLQIKIDGVDQGDAAPVTLLDLTPGEHKVEITHPAYLPHAQTLELGSGAFKSIYVEMKPRI